MGRLPCQDVVSQAGESRQVITAAATQHQGFWFKNSFPTPGMQEAGQTGFLSNRIGTVFPFQKGSMVYIQTSLSIAAQFPNNSFPQPPADITARDRHIFSLLSQLTFVLPQQESQRV